MNKTSKVFVIIVFVGIAIAFFIPYFIHPRPDNRYDSLHRVNDSLLMINAEIENKYKALELRSDSIKGTIQVSRHRVVYIKQKQENAIQVINSYNGNELFAFFANFTPKIDSAR